MNETSPETSIVIRAFNEERFLPRLLAAIAAQSYQDFEVIVVDSGSYDRTPQIAKEAGCRLLEIDSRDFTFGFSLNTGIRAARGRFIALASAHTEPANNEWLGRLIEPLRRPEVCMVYGRQLGGLGSKYSEVMDLGRIFGAQPLELSPPNFFANNANSAARRDLWELSPFDEVLPGLEDAAWAKHWMEQGFKVVYQPSAGVYHYHLETWPQVYRRHYREAVALRNIGLKSRSQAASEPLAELRNLFRDLYWAFKSGGLLEKSKEIIYYRTCKALGMSAGLLNGAPFQEPKKRDAFYYERQGRAVVIHGPNKAALEQADIPEIKPGDVLIEVAYVGVCGTDLEILSGKLGYYQAGLAKYPIVPGHELSGRIARVGSNVQGFGRDDPVVVECIQSCGSCGECLKGNWIGCAHRQELGVLGLNGGYADYLSVPARFVHRLPEGLDLKKAALCEPTAVSLKGLKRISWALNKGEKKARCGVFGAGPIGHLCAQVLALWGHEVTVFDNDPRRLAFFQGGPIRAAASLAELAEKEVLIEATGDPQALHHLLEQSKPGSTALLLGLPYSRREFSFESVVTYDKTIVGSVGSSAAEFREALGLLNRLPLDPFLEHLLPLEEFREAWEGCRQREHLKTLLSLVR